MEQIKNPNNDLKCPSMRSMTNSSFFKSDDDDIFNINIEKYINKRQHTASFLGRRMSLFTKKNQGDDDSIESGKFDSSEQSGASKKDDLKNKSSSQASVGRYDTRATINYRAYWDSKEDDNDGYIIRQQNREK